MIVQRKNAVNVVVKCYLAVAPEQVGIIHFSDEIVQAGYDHTKQLVCISWDQPVNFSLLDKMIEFNISDKADCCNRQVVLNTFLFENSSLFP
ncbi:hypothetical protein C0674_01315 [Sporolactobacillus terrae]|uniref:Uncharacterized protein n=1 Tax=Sporolactobacillus terrae TaxID=269673 RepID=A0ABX5Q421_9BACL|nr:hypothetical protein C0674_01315 [Sporolactobacillus terrae]QAA24350.1 hypothetical protein C0679_01295 [Sporolactobacillus terrae]